MSKLGKATLAAATAAAAYGTWRAARREANRWKNAKLPRGRRIMILGAGFGGTSAAGRLAELLPDEGDGEILLVDQRDYLLFTPMLPEVAGGELDPLDIVRPPRAISSRVRFLQGEVHKVNLANRRVTLRAGTETQALDADYIVIALGAVSNFHHVPGAREHALTMKGLEDAQVLRNRAIEMLERAEAERDTAKRRALLAFVVAGGGLTGVETMAALNSFVREAARDYRNIQSDEISMYLFEHGNHVLPELDPELAGYAAQELRDRGVRIETGAALTHVGDDFVEVGGKRRIASATLVWAGGVKPSPAVETMDCRRGHHGGIAVDGNCSVPDRENVWAIGDCAEIPKPGGGTYSPTAQNAVRAGSAVADNVVAAMRGRPQKSFQHHTIGEMALVGKRAGVAQIYGVRISGLFAWMLWRLVYLSKMPGWPQRARILCDWTLDLIFGRQAAAIPPTGTERTREEQTSGMV